MKYETKILPSGIIIENKPNSYQTYCWYIKGTWIAHNEGKPAFEDKDGDKFWYQHGKCHRLDGPAREYPNGNKYHYYINDVFYNEEEYWIKIKEDSYLKDHPELEAFV